MFCIAAAGNKVVDPHYFYLAGAVFLISRLALSSSPFKAGIYILPGFFEFLGEPLILHRFLFKLSLIFFLKLLFD